MPNPDDLLVRHAELLDQLREVEAAYDGQLARATAQHRQAVAQAAEAHEPAVAAIREELELVARQLADDVAPSPVTDAVAPPD